MGGWVRCYSGSRLSERSGAAAVRKHLRRQGGGPASVERARRAAHKGLVCCTASSGHPGASGQRLSARPGRTHAHPLRRQVSLVQVAHRLLLGGLLLLLH